MGVAASIEGTDILRNVHLVDCNHHLSRPLSLVLEPSVGHSEVQIASHLDRRISPQEDLPVVVDSLKNRGEVDVQLREILEAHRVEKDLHLLALGIGHHLPGNVDAVGLVEDVETHMVGKVGIPDLLVGTETNLNNMFGLLSGDLGEWQRTPGTLLMSSSTSIWQ